MYADHMLKKGRARENLEFYDHHSLNLQISTWDIKPIDAPFCNHVTVNQILSYFDGIYAKIKVWERKVWNSSYQKEHRSREKIVIHQLNSIPKKD